MTGVTEVSIAAVNTTQETIGLVGSNKSTKIHQGRTILVHERGEHRRPRPEHREWGGALPGHRPRLAQIIVTGLCDRNNVAPLGLTIHSQMKVVPSTSLGVHDPSVRFRKGQIKVHSFRPGFLAGNHSARTGSIVTGESTRLLVQGSKGSKRSMMDHEPHGWVVVAAPDDLSGHQDTSFA